MPTIFDQMELRESPSTNVITNILDMFKNQIESVWAESGNIYVECGEFGVDYDVDGETMKLLGITILPEYRLRRAGSDKLMLLGIFRRQSGDEFFITLYSTDVDTVSIINLHMWATLNCPHYRFV